MAVASSPAYDFYLVLDFEATCDEKVKPKPQEIIEFPVLKVNSRTLTTEAEFHQYVRPTEYPQLSAFCTQLTGITQDMVTNQPDLKTTMEMFHNWMRENGLLDPSHTSCFVTCGDWDLKTIQKKLVTLPVVASIQAMQGRGQTEMVTEAIDSHRLPGQCQYFGIKRPSYFNHWINIKKVYVDVTKTSSKVGMVDMLHGLGLDLNGRHHSGIDDSRNIAQILKALAQERPCIQATGSYSA